LREVAQAVVVDGCCGSRIAEGCCTAGVEGVAVALGEVAGTAMEEKEVFDRVKKIVVAQLGVAPDSVTMAMSFT
jgi:hypothetical protein